MSKRIKITLKERNGYMARLARLERLIGEAHSLSQHGPDFWVNDAEPGYEHRLELDLQVRGAQQAIRKLKETYLALGLPAEPNQ